MKNRFKKFLCAEKMTNLRNALFTTRWWQIQNFYEYYSFLLVKVWFQRILKEFKVTILEKFIFEKVPISTFNPNFWPLGGAKTKF